VGSNGKPIVSIFSGLGQKATGERPGCPVLYKLRGHRGAGPKSRFLVGQFSGRCAPMPAQARRRAKADLRSRIAIRFSVRRPWRSPRRAFSAVNTLAPATPGGVAHLAWLRDSCSRYLAGKPGCPSTPSTTLLPPRFAWRMAQDLVKRRAGLRAEQRLQLSRSSRGRRNISFPPFPALPDAALRGARRVAGRPKLQTAVHRVVARGFGGRRVLLPGARKLLQNASGLVALDPDRGPQRDARAALPSARSTSSRGRGATVWSRAGVGLGLLRALRCAYCQSTRRSRSCLRLLAPVAYAVVPPSPAVGALRASRRCAFDEGRLAERGERSSCARRPRGSA